MRYFLTLFLFFSLFFNLFSQSNHFDKSWKKAKALEEKGLWQQAYQEIDIIYTQAQKEANSIQIVKSLIYKANYRLAYQEEAILKSIEDMEKQIAQSIGVEKALLLTAQSDLYLQYYYQNQWQIREKQTVEGELPKDMVLWSQSDFSKKIESLLLEALNYKKQLQQTSVEPWVNVFRAKEEAFLYQPFLYDIVVEKAISFYNSSEFSEQAKEDLVLLQNPAYFKSYISFSQLAFGDLETLSYKEKVLKLYQELAVLHKGRKNATPLLFEEVNRLKFLKQKSTLENNEELLIATLSALIQDFKGQSVVAIPAKELIAIYIDRTQEEGLLKAQELCQQMLLQEAKDTYFQETIDFLQQEDLSIEMNETLLPQQWNLGQIRFKNTTNVWYRIVSLQKEEINESMEYLEKDFEPYLSKDALAQGQWHLSSEKRLIFRTAEIALPPLPLGRYAILISNSPDFNPKDNLLNIGFFWVSKLQLIHQEKTLLVVDRLSGEPISNALVQVYSNKWEYSSRKNIEKLELEAKTNTQGVVLLPEDTKSARYNIKIYKAQDEWQSKTISTYSNNRKTKAREKHHFFTDRAIYRPGQTVYFKGIFMEEHGNKNKILPHKESTIKFYNAQGKLLSSQSLTSNEFGSVSGSFVCPQGGLNGQFRISDKYGNHSLRMEEYKRPKFEIELQLPAQEYVLNDSIQIVGKASYYAGVGLQNAQVSYKVMRHVFMPWRWSYYPLHSQEIAITAGKTITAEDGSFHLDFSAIAPKNIEGLQWYHYSIKAIVSDVTGETHEQEISVNIGSQSMYISTDLPAIMDIQQAKDISIKAQTPNGLSLDKNLNFKLELLESPTKISLKNPWQSDTSLISSTERAENFPLYHEKQSIKDYKIQALVLEKKGNTKTDSLIPKSIFQNLSPGYYKMTLSSQDKNNKQVEETAFIQLFSSKDKKLKQAQKAFFYIDKNMASVGDIIKINFGSSFKQGAYYYQLYRGRTLLKAQWNKIKNNMDNIQIPIGEDDRGGLNMQIFFVHDNRFYSFREQISVPFEDKELDMRLVSLRNPMQTGTKERWTLWIRNQNGEAVAAEVLAGMYDASLDVFAPNKWSLWPYSATNSSPIWKDASTNFNSISNKENIYRSYPSQHVPVDFAWSYFNRRRSNEMVLMATPMSEQKSVRSEDVSSPPRGGVTDVIVEDNEDISLGSISEDQEKKEVLELSPRKNLQETAFFFPQLRTDKEGYVQLEFTSPEALSRWNLMVLSHSKDLEIASLSKSVSTQKQVMVMPNIPRFLRAGDKIHIRSKIINLSTSEERITASLEVLDAISMKPLGVLALGAPAQHYLSLNAQGQTTVDWQISVPEKVGALVIRIMAKGKVHSDGEEHILPVLSPLQLLTDTYPFFLQKEGVFNSQEFGLPKKEWKAEDKLTLEITPNPYWYVVQALPNYNLPKNPAALDWLNYYFAHSMSSFVVKQHPEIESVIAQWKLNDPQELESELAQNEELKQILLQETPWWQDSQSQKDRKAAIVQLFDKNQLAYSQGLAMGKLKELQQSSGAWSWYKGMRESRSITSEIVNAFGQLHHKRIVDLATDNTAKYMLQKAVKYLDQELLILLKAEQESNKNYQARQILKARAWFLEEFPLTAESQKAYDYYLSKWQKKWAKNAILSQAKLAQVLWLSGEIQQAQAILASLKDQMLENKQGGLYWRDLSTYNAPENQAQMIGLMEMTQAEKHTIDGLKLWLLQQKRSNDWGNNKSTAQACYAMLSDEDKLAQSPNVKLHIQGQDIDINRTAGSAYFKQTWKGDEINKVLDHLEIVKSGDAMSFGAFYVQHFQEIKEIKAHKGGVSVQKEIFVSETKDNRQTWRPLKERETILLGQKVLMRLFVDNEQAMDYVHLRNYFPSGFEPLKSLSGNFYQFGLFFYQSQNDVATDYFIQHLPKGKFVIEQQLFATSAGVLSMGPAEIQSLYAPEFSGHSPGGQVVVALPVMEKN